MSSDHFLELPNCLDSLDSSLFATLDSPSYRGNDHDVHLFSSSPNSFPVDANTKFGPHITPLSKAGQDTPQCPASPVSIFVAPGSFCPLSNTGYYDSLDSLPFLPIPTNCPPIAVQSTYSSPVLSAIDIAPSQVRAISQPPEELPFLNADETPTVKSTQSMSFHRIVQPRGKRANAYHPYSRRHEGSAKRKTPAKADVPRSTPKIVPLGESTIIEAVGAIDAFPQDQRHTTVSDGPNTEIEKSARAPPRAARAPSPVCDNDPSSFSSQIHNLYLSRGNASMDSLAEFSSAMGDTTIFQQDNSTWHKAQTSSSLKLTSYIQSLIQICSEMHYSLRETLAIQSSDDRGIDKKLKLER